MGILLSMFRKRVTTKEKLEEIEQELDDIEDFRFSTQQLQRLWVGRLIIYSVIVNLFGALLFFLYFFPSELSKQLLYSLPLLIFPLIVYALKWLLHWYYAYKLAQTTDQMVLLQRKKRKLLKEVMTTETYVIAKEILEKYDPDQIRHKAGLIPFAASNALSPVAASLPDTDMRRRSVPTRSVPTQPIRPLNSIPRASTLIRPGYNAPPGTTVAALPYPRTIGVRPLGVPLPCPILPRQRGTIDRLVEFVVGDGPNNRYALICRQCQSHNGMALREEFEYIGFRCCYCFFLNPARKQRPLAPRLQTASLLAIAGAAGDKQQQPLLPMDEDSNSEGPAEATDGDDEESVKLSPPSSDKEQAPNEAPLKMQDASGDFVAGADNTQDVTAVLEVSPIKPVEAELPAKEAEAADANNDTPTPKKELVEVADDAEIITMTSQPVDEGELTSQSERESRFQSDE